MARDEDCYVQAMHEYESGIIDASLKVKATVLAKGKVEIVKFEYVELRAEQLRSEKLKAMPVTIVQGTVSGIRAIRDARANSISEQKREKRRKAQLRAIEENANKSNNALTIAIVLCVFIGMFMLGGLLK